MVPRNIYSLAVEHSSSIFSALTTLPFWVNRALKNDATPVPSQTLWTVRTHGYAWCWYTRIYTININTVQQQYEY